MESICPSTKSPLIRPDIQFSMYCYLYTLSFSFLLAGVALQDNFLLPSLFLSSSFAQRMLMPDGTGLDVHLLRLFANQAAPLSPPPAAVPWWMSPPAAACGACGARQIWPRPARRRAGIRKAQGQSRGRGRHPSRWCPLRQRPARMGVARGRAA